MEFDIRSSPDDIQRIYINSDKELFAFLDPLAEHWK